MTGQASVIRWEELPPARGRGSAYGRSGSRYAAVAEQLRARPGEWAVVKEDAGHANGLATHIRMGQMKCFTPAGDFDAATRRVGGCTVTYARYLGDQDGEL